MVLFIQISLFVLCLFTGLQFIRLDHWWVRIADFTHIQVFVLTLLCLVFLLINTPLNDVVNITLVGFGLLTLLYQAYIIYPYTPLHSKVAKSIKRIFDEDSISILESNVFMDNTNYQLLLDQVAKENPDIVITLETGTKWSAALSVLDQDYPHSSKVPFDNTYGMMLFSKLPLIDTSVNYLVEEEVPSIETTVKLPHGTMVKLHVIHPKPPSPSENYMSTERDAELIIVGKKAKAEKMPVIVAGDLNDVAWSHTTRLFQRISQLLDPRIGRGFFNTFNSKYWLLRWPLDHVFHSDDFLVRRVARLPHIGSDHFPLYIELVYKPITGPARNTMPEEADAADRKESRDKLLSVDAVV